MNSVNIIGNLVNDPDYRVTNSGTGILRFTIAYNSRRKNGDNWEDVANFFDCELYGKRADTLKQYIAKGSRVGVIGSLEQQRWQSKEGKTQSRVVIHVAEVDLLSERKSRDDNSYQEPKRSNPRPAPVENYNDDEVPF